MLWKICIKYVLILTLIHLFLFVQVSKCQSTMSADSPRRTSRKGSTGHLVLPRPVSDTSLIDSLAGFIHEVVPQVRDNELYKFSSVLFFVNWALLSYIKSYLPVIFSTFLNFSWKGLPTVKLYCSRFDC